MSKLNLAFVLCSINKPNLCNRSVELSKEPLRVKSLRFRIFLNSGFQESIYLWVSYCLNIIGVSYPFYIFITLLYYNSLITLFCTSTTHEHFKDNWTRSWTWWHKNNHGKPLRVKAGWNLERRYVDSIVISDTAQQPHPLPQFHELWHQKIYYQFMVMFTFFCKLVCKDCFV